MGGIAVMTISKQRAAASALMLGFACQCFANEHVKVDVQVSRDIVEPQLVAGILLVRNESRMRVPGWASISLDTQGPCSHAESSYRTLKSSDPRLASQVAFEMLPGSWFASWQPFWRPSVGCKLLGQVALTEQLGGKEMTRITRRAAVPAPFGLGAPPSKMNEEFEFETIVWKESFILHGREPAGTALQVQILVKNLARAPRTIAITSREIDCERRSYAYVVGPGEGHPLMTSGPIELQANGWGVLAQRIRGFDDPSQCRFRIIVSERRASSSDILREDRHSGDHWREVMDVTGELTPIGTLEYLSY